MLSISLYGASLCMSKQNVTRISNVRERERERVTLNSFLVCICNSSAALCLYKQTDFFAVLSFETTKEKGERESPGGNLLSKELPKPEEKQSSQLQLCVLNV